MEKHVYNAFVESWTNDKVTCFIVEEKGDQRVFEHGTLFNEKKLFSGMQLILTVTIQPGVMTIVCKEVNLNKFQQLKNYILFRCKLALK